MAGGAQKNAAACHSPNLSSPEGAMATINDVACDFTNMLRVGQFEAAGEKYWANDVKSVEPVDLPGGIPARVSGIEAVRAKSKNWFGTNRIDDLSIDGPFVTGNQFALFMDMAIVTLASGDSQPFTEIALYTVRDTKITEERYFYD
jgi:hypothetical protein